ncbi:MAG: aminodeoxychorismate/anthranilate synthase component II [Candidatus Krumholzibacteriia bacterium]
MASLLVIDNYDSFTYNLVLMFRAYPATVDVRRADAVGLDDLDRLAPDYLVIGPGPRDPAHAGISCAALGHLPAHIPALGVCLGLQCLNEVHGGRTVRCTPMHGKVSPITHAGRGLFAGLPSPLRVARYHSLAAEPAAEALQDTLEVTARDADGTIMGLSHRRRPVHAVQFHPESFLTEHGDRLIAAFMALGPAGGAS